MVSASLAEAPDLVARHLAVGCSTGFMSDMRSDWPALVERAGAVSHLAVELSALSLNELPRLIEYVGAQVRLPFEFVSVHGPSKRLDGITDADLVAALLRLPPSIDAIVMHPDTIRDAAAFRPLGRSLALENMDARKDAGRSAEELAPYFDELPEATLCFDIAHAKSIDADMTEGERILDRFGHRLQHVHLSSLNAECHHVTLTQGDQELFEPLLARCRDVPWILEAPLVAE